LRLFDACSDPERSTDELISILRTLSPGNGRVGYRQVNLLIDHLRTRIAQFMEVRHFFPHQLVPHDHVFGSGGDFFKTIHASTISSIVVAPLLTICKTGTNNVTSLHGSAQAMQQIGYGTYDLNVEQVNAELRNSGFAFISLGALGFPYSAQLKAAREYLWREAKQLFEAKCAVGKPGWQDAIQSTTIPLDIFKTVPLNAQVLYPQHHTTGVCAPGMLPYVLSIYLHLQSQGLIVYNYDSIDEVANASSDPTPYAPNNLLLHVSAEEIALAECSPEDLGFARAELSEIREEEDLDVVNDDFWNIISGRERGPKRDFIAANTAVLLVAAGQVPAESGDLIAQLRVGIKMVEDLIDSGRSEENFRHLLATHNQNH
jgi:anthranilate phosphoribosyltransferase